MASFWEKIGFPVSKKRKQKREKTQEEQIEEVEHFMMTLDNDHVQKIYTEFHKPFIDNGQPWGDNNDWGFLTKIWHNATFSRFLNLRRALAVSTDYSLSWDLIDLDDNRIDVVGVEKYIKRLLDPRRFDFHFYCDCIWLSRCSGLEAAEPEWVFDSKGNFVPGQVYHIDNRRWKFYKKHDTDSVRYKLGIRDGVNFKARALTDFESERIHIFRNDNYEYTLGIGRGIFNFIYFLWRFRAFIDELMQICAEKHSIPIITVSPAAGAGWGGDVAGKTMKSLIRQYVEMFKKAKSGNVFGATFPANISVHDFAPDKLGKMKEIAQYLDTLAGDCILGASGMLLNQRSTYGAHRSQSQLALQFIYEDRDYVQTNFNKHLVPMLYNFNKSGFAKYGVKSIDDVPLVTFQYAEQDPKNQIEKLKAANELNYKVDVEDAEKVLGMNITENESALDENTTPEQQSFESKYDEEKHPRGKDGKWTSSGASRSDAKSEIKKTIKEASTDVKKKESIADKIIDKIRAHFDGSPTLAKLKDVHKSVAGKLEKAGYSKKSANIISATAAILMSTPASVTTLLSGIGVLGVWGTTPGLGGVEGATVYGSALGIKKVQNAIKAKNKVEVKNKPEDMKSLAEAALKDLNNNRKKRGK